MKIKLQSNTFTIILCLLLTFGSFNFIYFVHFFNTFNYLPSPFIVDKNDTFMDLYNPLFWVLKDSFYSNYKSVYPPLNYLILKSLFLLKAPEISLSPFTFRDAYPSFAFILIIIFVLNLFILTNIGNWRRLSVWTRLSFFFTLLISTPVLFKSRKGEHYFFNFNTSLFVYFIRHLIKKTFLLRNLSQFEALLHYTFHSLSKCVQI
jgi:hypothetical protein